MDYEFEKELYLIRNLTTITEVSDAAQTPNNFNDFFKSGKSGLN